jgi:serine/threonine protein kinase
MKVWAEYRNLYAHFWRKPSRLDSLVPWFKYQMEEVTQARTETMFYFILLALDRIHTYNLQIIHRDIKPPNILFQATIFSEQTLVPGRSLTWHLIKL